MKNLLCFFIVFVFYVAVSYSQDIYYLPGSTEKIDQMVGDYDRHSEKATQNLTDTKYRIWGTDLGVPFTHEGKTYVLFGDIPGDIGYGLDRDPIAFTTDNDPEDGIGLEFITRSDGTYLPLTIPGISQAALEVPLDGISINGNMYVYHSTDHMTRSVLAKSTDEGRSFTLVDDKISDQFFINISINKITKSMYQDLPGSDNEGVVVIGSGTYRQSSAYLYHQPSGEIEDHQSIQYFAGFRNNKPTWSRNESDCVPIIEDHCIGELSSAYNPHLNKWVVLYNCDNPRGIVLRMADKPWGPYSSGEVIFDPDRDNGYCHFIHTNWQVRNCDAVHDPGRENEWGGEYGPYIFKDLTTRVDSLVTIYYTMSTWNPYTTVLMKSVLVIQDRTNSIDHLNYGSEITPHPNPTSGIFILPITDIHQSNIKLYNINGKIVYEAKFTEQVNISSLPAGIYFGSTYENNKSTHFFKVLKTD